MQPTRGYAAKTAKSQFEPFEFERREPSEKDVTIEILYCGICHSDIHSARDEWGGATFPMVPGHKIAGRVSESGRRSRNSNREISRASDVLWIRTGLARAAKKDWSNIAIAARPLLMGARSESKDGKTPTYGGYSSQIVVDENYVLKIPQGAPLERVAPLMCAGSRLIPRLNIGK